MAGAVKAVGKVFKGALKAPLKVLGISKPKAPLLPAPPGVPMRDEAAASAERRDTVANRSGRASTLLLGELGEEAAGTASKRLLGSN
jgi:hypothetical protein